MIPIRTRGGASPRYSRQAVAEAPPSRVVRRPVPEREVKDARSYQIEQLKRRYSAKEVDLDGELSLLFNLSPSDPDFPFDLDHLECDLRIPTRYPRQSPRLHIKNGNIPRGFAINIERGWDKLVEEKRGATLLALTNALDRRLESLLSEQKAETVKLTIFKGSRPQDAEPAPVAEEAPAAKHAPESFVVGGPYIPEESHSREQIAEAKARRAQEVRQLETRMSRLALYHRSSDGVVYTLPLEPKRRADLPVGLRQVQSVQLIIPLLYPLQSLRILLNDVESEDAGPLEELFAQKAAEQKHMSLMSQLNYLAQNMHTLAKQVQAPPVGDRETGEAERNVAHKANEAEHSSTLDAEKGHIRIIPRPPEWAADDGSDDWDESDEESYEEDEDDGEVAIEQGQTGGPSLPSQTQERGTALLFPSIELHGIELLQVSILSLSLKCDRCKTLNELRGLKDNLEKSSSCKKCATPFTVRFRQEFVHQNSTRAGFIDATACTVADLLPSTFLPTCGRCSTAAGGLVSVRGEATTNVCRECHARFTFKIPDVKFLAYGPGSLGGALPAPRRRQQQEKLGLHAGEPLPNRGACVHYRRSHRWFRFSCCNKVHPCDKCHDAVEDHVNEWANRMICGWCSREQRYRVEDCAFCGRSVIGKRGKGYWEGGKGTRNQVLMRRGDKRKYRRLGPGAKKEE